jgi:proline dehydrogenase
LIDPEILHRASTTLLRLRPTISTTSVPYPGAPISADRQILAPGSIKSKSLDSIIRLKGAVDNMGVLQSDEGIREGDLEALQDLWTKLKSLGERAKKNG